jgi:FtsP/CotA-like multicopper oxidase with cupredoxin domain
MKPIAVWGFNGTAPGPTIRVNQGDHARVVFENHLPEPSSLHWHGFGDTISNDGMPSIGQSPVNSGAGVSTNSISIRNSYFYHSHPAMQEMAGMLGGVIMHPKDEPRYGSPSGARLPVSTPQEPRAGAFPRLDGGLE